jgi:hypothetical protein
VDYSCRHCPSGKPIRNNNGDSNLAGTVAKTIDFKIVQDIKERWSYHENVHSGNEELHSWYVALHHFVRIIPIPYRVRTKRS